MTDVGYTGHRHNNTNANDLGLIYMNARYYLPGLGRFASADTVIPEPFEPQSHNRFSYVYNNPLILIDPSGHCGEDSGNGTSQDTEAIECQKIRTDIFDMFGVSVLGIWELEQIQTLWLAMQDLITGFGGIDYVRAAFSGISVVLHSGEDRGAVMGTYALNMHLFENTFAYGFNYARYVILHEFGHAFDIRIGLAGSAGLQSSTGGITDCKFLIFGCQYSPGGTVISGYSNTNAREDFAEAFALYMYGGDLNALVVEANTYVNSVRGSNNNSRFNFDPSNNEDPYVLFEARLSYMYSLVTSYKNLIDNNEWLIR